MAPGDEVKPTYAIVPIVLPEVSQQLEQIQEDLDELLGREPPRIRFQFGPVSEQREEQ